VRRFVFVGVETGGSSIRTIFPAWRDRLALGEDVVLDGVDIPVGAPPERYRTVAAALLADEFFAGALVTTHKLALYDAAADLFAELDDYARLCTEISCMAKRDGRLLGWAKDPISAGRALDDLLGPRYFERTGGDVLCIGAGGAGTAIALCLMARAEASDPPRRIVIADAAPARLGAVQELHRKLESSVPLECHVAARPGDSDALLAGLPAGSVVINATGMGKDRPGSPVSDDARFPDGAVVWELNYRGALDFLHQAKAQEAAGGLRVEDGWRYFIFGWTAAIEEVFQRPISLAEIELLAADAEFARPSRDVTRAAADSAGR
jgi:shikimate 5-dehydrogenase